MAIYFKFKNSNESNDDIQVVNTLLVGTAENRHHAPIEGCDDMPPLLNYDGTIYDMNTQTPIGYWNSFTDSIEFEEFEDSE